MATLTQDEYDECDREYRVEDDGNAVNLTQQLNRLRHEGTLCDVTIIVGKTRFPAHKVVLSSASEYFYGMFSSGFQESTMSEVTIEKVTAEMEESFAEILEFAYTGNFHVSMKMIIGYLKMACYLLMTDAVKSCRYYLEEVKDKLTIDDCYEIWSLVSNHKDLSDIALMFQSHMSHNFLKCLQSNIFLEHCPASAMMDILGCEEIETDIITEEQILEGTLLWLKHDWKQRKVHAVDLLKKIRLGLVPVNRLRQILGGELLSIPECENVVEEIVTLSDTKDTATPPLIKSHPDVFATRNTITANLRNVRRSNTGSIFPMTCITETACFKLTKLSNPNADVDNRPIVRVIVSNTGHLYALGAYQITGRLPFPSDLFRYDAERNEWITLQQMPRVIKVKPRLFQIDQYICAVCLYDFRIRIERYCVPTNTWVSAVEHGFVSDNVHVVDAAAVHRHIIFTGAFRASGDNVTNIPVLVYNPVKGTMQSAVVNGHIDQDSSYFIEREDECYLVKGRRGRTPDQIKKCVFDLDGGRPTITIGEIVERNLPDIEDQKLVEFTFDKRKLGLVELFCGCPAHSGKESRPYYVDSDDDCVVDDDYEM